jgi:hypothetical protein
MLNHLSDKQIESYQQLKMSPTELLAADDHLAQCDLCHQRLSQSFNFESSYAYLRKDLEDAYHLEPLRHILPEQFIAYIDNNLDSVAYEIAESHMKVCTQCRSTLHDLQAFRAMGLDSQNEHAENKPKDSTKLTLWQKLTSYFEPITHLVPLQVAGIVAVLTMAILVAKVSIEKNRNNQQAENQPVANTDLQAKLDNPDHQKSSTQPNENVKNTNVSSSIQIPAPDLNKTSTDKDPIIASNKNYNNVPPTPYKEEIDSALSTGQISTPQFLSQLVGQKETLMGEANAETFHLKSPTGTVIQSNRPTLRWEQLNGATTYKVTVLDPDFNEVVNSESLTTNEWSIPTTLKRGGTYLWQVTAIKDGKELTSSTSTTRFGKFKVIEQQKFNQLERLKKAYADSPLKLGVAFATEGLLDDAEQAFQIHLKKEPTSSMARKFLTQVKSLR